MLYSNYHKLYKISTYTYVNRRDVTFFPFYINYIYYGGKIKTFIIM